MRNIKVGETASENLRAYFDVRLLDGSPALAEAGGQPQYSLNGGSFNFTALGTLIQIQYGRYYAQFDSSIFTTPGDVILTRYKSGITTETSGDSFLVVSASGDLPDDSVSVAHYGSVGGGDAYFVNSLMGRVWKKKDPDTKRRSLIDATRVIDRLNFSGDKADSLQVLQFPRGNSYTDPRLKTSSDTFDVNVPDDIKNATYLIADRLLDGWDPDMEADTAAVKVQKYQGASTEYDREYLPEHVRAGIPSARAWGLLRPYVRDPQEVALARL